MGARLAVDQLYYDWSAGFGQFVTRASADGPGTSRFEVTAGARTVVFRNIAEVAWALCLSGGQVTRFMLSEQVLRLAVAGAERGDYAAAAQRDPGGHTCGRKRFGLCVDVAGQVWGLTHKTWAYAGLPQLHPDWRVNHQQAGSAGGQVAGRARLATAVVA